MFSFSNIAKQTQKFSCNKIFLERFTRNVQLENLFSMNSFGQYLQVEVEQARGKYSRKLLTLKLSLSLVDCFLENFLRFLHIAIVPASEFSLSLSFLHFLNCGFTILTRTKHFSSLHDNNSPRMISRLKPRLFEDSSDKCYTIFQLPFQRLFQLF